ncbi:DUF11 domain-containing protein [Urbifossiella limnaea]|uniref:Large cysteine-rich periplasmic protein OmcB n=1 Tax=Urbifossiella limnaea TaxID=2528023 RepID=A0A517XPV6_9BACT|nr:DUF11 domain-containing protein [Urbifossiella limnaea]QDU19537.1 Large cysteine-rich periplasmic protein OmcB precursor [Urbifossiella limnaea]
MTAPTLRRLAATTAALALLATTLRAQPEPFPVRPADVPPLELPEEPATIITDPNVVPAQFQQPVSLDKTQPVTLPRPVADPPPPVVRVQVRVPADSPPGDDIKYVLTVTNSSAADAHRVTIRNPIPDGIEQVVKAAPQFDEAPDKNKQLTWSLGTLKGGESKTIELVLKPKADAKEVKNLAYVRFEHGEATTTRIARPGLKITRSAPKQSVKDEPFTVRVLVENTGKVPAEKVKIVETLTATAQVQAVTTGVKRTRPEDNQWQWELGTLLPGQRKVVEFRVSPQQAGEAAGTTVVTAEKGILEKTEGRTQVLVSGLSVRLDGPKGIVNPGESARYEITVRNTGTLPSTNVRVTGSVPADCRPTMKTDGGQLYRDAVVWTVPKLEPGEAMTLRYGLKAATSGRRVVVASAADARKARDSQELATVFQGTAALVWEQTPDPAALAKGRNGTVTVRVRNTGGEEARNVRLEVELPPEVGYVQSTPQVRAENGKVVFGPEAVSAGGERVYTITYQAERPGQAWFRFRLAADALGDRPVTTEKSVEITGGG